MKFIVLAFLTIALCFSVQAKNTLNKRNYPELYTDCIGSASEISHHLNKYYKKLRDVTHGKDNKDFDHVHQGAIEHLKEQAAETISYIHLFEHSCQQAFYHVPAAQNDALFHSMRGHCETIKGYYEQMNIRIPELRYYNSAINSITLSVLNECSLL